MKKLLIASAALAMVAGTAQAQSSVTIYGAYGNGLTSTKTGSANAVNTMAGDRVGTPVLGFMGTEDLGGGNKAFFKFESTLGANGSLGTANTNTFTSSTTADTASPSNVFDRHAHVGISTANYGTLSLGRQQDSVKDTENLTVFNNLSDATQTTTVGDRYANVVKYVTPTISGLSASVSYADNVTGSGTYNNAGVNDGSTLNSYNIQYTTGTYKFAYAHGEIVTSAGARTKTSRYGAQGKVMNATVGVSYTDNSPSAADKEASEVTLAVSYPFGNGFTGMASYSDYSAKTTSTGATNAALNGNGYALLVTKDLSKRTQLYAGYSLKDYDAANTADAGDVKITAFGLLHKF
jgi:predicted porin